MKIQHFVLLSWCCFVFTSFGQTYPFPQNIKYPHGFMPTTITSEKEAIWYDSTKANKNLFQSCNGGVRPACENSGESKVEAMGWTMIFTAYMGDKTTFDGLYTFYKSKCKSSNGGMMDWHVSCSGVVEGGSATDGDMDVGFGLCVAGWQWGQSYTDEAKKVIANLKKLIVNCNGTSALNGGYGYGGCNETDISYYTPAFFRVFADVTGDAAWTKLADDTYTVLNNGANATTGLVPDWQTVSGQAGANGRNGTYKYDACRVPWRIALDYFWNGNEKALAWCKKISTWANGVGPSKIVDGYNLNGQANGSYHNLSYVGGFAVAAMCNTQEIADAFAAEVNKMSFDTYWYHAFLGNCYMLAMTGNMWRPDLIKDNVKKNVKISTSNPLKVSIAANRKLVVSGLQNVRSVVLTDLEGHQVIQSNSVTGKQVSMDIGSVKHGCYIVGIINENGILHNGQKVFVF